MFDGAGTAGDKERRDEDEDDVEDDEFASDNGVTYSS